MSSNFKKSALKRLDRTVYINNVKWHGKRWHTGCNDAENVLVTASRPELAQHKPTVARSAG
jgi:hypothetical protein